MNWAGLVVEGKVYASMMDPWVLDQFALLCYSWAFPCPSPPSNLMPVEYGLFPLPQWEKHSAQAQRALLCLVSATAFLKASAQKIISTECVCLSSHLFSLWGS